MKELITISRFSKKNGFTTNKILTFLIEKKFLKKKETSITKVKNLPFELIINNTQILVEEDKLLSFLKKQKLNFVTTYNEIENLNLIKDKTILSNRLKTVITKKIVIIDFEFSNGKINEFAYQTFENGKMIDDGYYFDENFISMKNLRKIEKLKYEDKTFEMLPYKELMKLIKEKITNVDYIIAHNAHGERSLLKMNGIDIEKQYFLCTSVLTKNLHQEHFNETSKVPSLIDCIKFFNLRSNPSYFHYAFYDVEKTTEVFFKMIEGV